MKIAYFLDAVKGLGGAGNVLLEQASIMNKMYNVFVVIPFDGYRQINTSYLFRCKNMKLKYVELNYKTAYSFQYIDLISAWEDSRKIKDWAEYEGIDFFHSVQLNVAVELVSRELKIPHLMNVYQLRKAEFLFAGMDMFPRYHSCDSILYCTEWEKNLGVRSCCIRPSAPLDTLHRKQRKRKKSLNIVMLGGLYERKNQMTAIRAVEYCRNKGMDIKLVIAGDNRTEYGKKCMNYIADNGISFVNIRGFCDDIVPLLCQNDCLLCTSTDESFPCSIVEALSYDLTIISTPVAGVPELLKNGVNAYICRGYTVEDVAERIEQCFLAHENGIVWKLHDRAELLWKMNFSRTIVRKKLSEYYKYILDNQKNSHPLNIQNIVSKEDINRTYIKLSKKREMSPIILERLYYYTCLEKILNDGSAYIWGAGEYGKIAYKLLEFLFPQLEIIGYVDKEKCGQYMGLPILHPEEIETGCADYIFLGFAGEKDASIIFLEGKGFEYNKSIWILP